MATASAMTADFKKPSFAKVAASATAESMSKKMVPRTAAPAATKDRQEQNDTVTPAIVMRSVPVTAGREATSVSVGAVHEPSVTADPAIVSKVVEGLKGLKLEAKTPSLVVSGSGSTSTDQSSKLGNSQTPSDDNSQKADSNSEFGTKPPSLDGKSITSGTTFNVLDEKESLRPDDSASVKAAAEDDDAFSIRGSLLANSRMGSEVAARVHRIQIGDMPPRTITQMLPEHHLQGVVTPPSGSSEQQPVVDVGMPLATAASASDAISTNPDEKLLEALKSPKDRLFLLRLEQDMIEFTQNSKEPFMDFPPSNSFCRMLTHRLADYYGITHNCDTSLGCVRIYKTPFPKVPPSLASIANASNSNTPPPAVLPRKIMRRGEDGELAPASAGPSKPTSEVGSDAKDKPVLSKERLSREEREEAYNKARERIFGTMVPTETSTPENEDSTGVSRASSVSAMDKSNPGKRTKPGRQRRDDSESFDSRSQYTAYYGHPQQPTWASPQYIPVANAQYSPQMPQQPYSNPMPPAFGPPNQPYPHMMPNMPGSAYVPQTTNLPQYPPQPAPAPAPAPAQPRCQPPNGSISPYSSPAQSAPQPAWQPNFGSQSPYQPRATPGQPGIPYAYGQLPVNTNPHDPKSQHPIPGSYAGNLNRHAFNPKTQSFVPGNGLPPLQPSPGPYNAPNQMAPALVGQPLIPYGGFQQPLPQAPYSGTGGDYSMMRQGSSNPILPYPPHPPQQPQQPRYQGPRPHGPPHAHPHVPQNPSARVPNKPALPQGPGMSGQPYSHLPNYGNPATLPQKPST